MKLARRDATETKLNELWLAAEIWKFQSIARVWMGFSLELWKKKNNRERWHNNNQRWLPATRQALSRFHVHSITLSARLYSIAWINWNFQFERSLSRVRRKIVSTRMFTVFHTQHRGREQASSHMQLHKHMEFESRCLEAGYRSGEIHLRNTSRCCRDM